MGPLSRILYAADGPHSAAAVRGCFNTEVDLQLDVVDTGAACLARLGAGSYDLLLLDRHLPDADGLDLFARLRAEGHALPVVVLTTDEADTGLLDCVRTSGDYLNELADTVRTVLGRRILDVESNDVDARRETTARVHGDVSSLAESFKEEIAERTVALREEEAARRTIEDQYRILVEMTHDLIQMVGADGHFTFVNAAWTAALGWTREEARRLSFRQVVHPADLARCEDYFASVQQGAPYEHIEVTFVTRDGRELSLEGDLTGVFEAGAFVATQSVFRDATARKAAEKALRASEQRLRLIIETEPECVKVVSAEGTLLEMNPAGLAMIQAERFDDVRGLSLGSLIAPEHRAAFEALHRRVIAGGEGVLAFEIIGLRGRRRWLETHAVPLRENDHDAALLGITRDITERRQSEEALRQSEARYRTIVETAEEGIWTIDAQSRTTFVNPKMESLLGYSIDEMIGHPLEDFMDEEGKRVQAVHMARRRNGITEQHESTFVRKDGSSLRAALSTSPILDGSGDFAGTLAMVTDISARLEAERTVRDTNRRLRALSNRLLEVQESERRLLAVELHDEVGQGLTAAKIRLQSQLQQAATGEAAGPLAETVAIIDRALEHTRALALRLRPALLDDLGLFPALRWMADQLVQPSGLRLDFDGGRPPRNCPKGVEMACFRIAQEALTNVIKHAGARRVAVVLHARGTRLDVYVRDDGSGFDLPAAQQRAAEGHSLGLVSMMERANLAGGGIEWQSTPGQGTEMHAWFPLVEAADPAVAV